MPLAAEAVRTRLRSACAEAGGIRPWAAAHGVSASLVSEVLAGRREPAERVLTPLGLRRLAHCYGPALEASA
ncbi:hypothetical protein FV233_05140 [Methylobacterium sp. WL7]|nr:hypothetical protein FV233_05140 [Methylobacterium sp. WL7]